VQYYKGIVPHLRNMVEGLQIRGLREGEEAKWLDLLGEAFADKGVTRDFFQRHAEADPHWCRESVRVCCEGEMLVSTVRVYLRKMRVYQRKVVDEASSAVVEIDVGAIGDVATVKSHRRRGIAALLLHNAHEYMESVG
jgi:GNAT superfamily N-acetyltransferase